MTLTITDFDVASTARVAANIIEEHGWHQGGYFPRTVPAEDVAATRCPVCIVAAIALAAGLRPDAWEYPARTPAQSWSRSLMQETTVAVGVYLGVFRPGEVPAEEDVPERLGDFWNDAPGRTAEQVVRALRATADGLGVAA